MIYDKCRPVPRPARAGGDVKYTLEDLNAALSYLEAEGYIERFVDSDGNDCVRICEGAEDCEV